MRYQPHLTPSEYNNKMLQKLRHESSNEPNLNEMAKFNVLVHHIRPVWYSCSQMTRISSVARQGQQFVLRGHFDPQPSITD